MICSITNCNKKAIYSNGLCSMHNHRLIRHGDPNILLKPQNPLRGCKTIGCNNKHRAKGYCSNCYHKIFGKIKYEKNKNDYLIRSIVQRERLGKEAISIYNKIWRLKNTQNKKQTDKNYYKSNPEKILQYHKNHYEKFGIVFNLNDRKYKYALQSWSNAVRNRDNHTCQICGNPAAHAHHLILKSSYPTLSLNVNNGISLCEDCHNEAHWRNLILEVPLIVHNI